MLLPTVAAAGGSCVVSGWRSRDLLSLLCAAGGISCALINPDRLRRARHLLKARRPRQSIVTLSSHASHRPSVQLVFYLDVMFLIIAEPSKNTQRVASCRVHVGGGTFNDAASHAISQPLLWAGAVAICLGHTGKALPPTVRLYCLTTWRP
jgi:hypothetical protein